MKPTNPLIVNSDMSILLEVRHPDFPEVRDRISPFLELEKSPEIFYTYRMNEISLWNGFSLGHKPEGVLQTLEKHAKFPIPDIVRAFVLEQGRHFGLVKLLPHQEETLEVDSTDKEILKSLLKTREISPLMYQHPRSAKYLIPRALQGAFKLEMIKLGFPVEDRVGFEDGDRQDLALNQSFSPRDYQVRSLDSFFGGVGGDKNGGGAGIIVLPCGAGKTVVGILAMARLQMKTLIIAPNIIALRQWKSELIAKTDITEKDIGEYSGERKDIRAITLATYQILVYRKGKTEAFKHLSLFNEENWGLIIYDEIHLLPAPVFRAIASIQARRRLGLTATLVREDGHERDVFALVGSKKFDLPWKELESKSYIAEAWCYEVKVAMDQELLREYYTRTEKNQHRLASENAGKMPVVAALLKKLEGHQILIIGQYLDQLEMIMREFKIPLITGKTPNEVRMKLYQDFREGKIKALIVSKVANFAIDLPDADVAIQISGTFGSRQEEAQRLGRILRPKPGQNRAYFFSLVSADTKEELYTQNRKRFLMEQGYQYRIVAGEDILQDRFTLENPASADPQVRTNFQKFGSVVENG